MTNENRVRWGSYSLRTLLILLTLAAIASAYVGYQRSVVQARKAFLKQLSNEGYQVTTQNEAAHAMQPMTMVDEPDPSVPLVRGWLGDEAIATIGFYPYLSPKGDKRAQIQRLVPEARLVEFEPPQDPCHPGCFPHGTLVETAAGPQRIETITVGDEVYSISPEGKKILLPVVSIFRTTNRLWIVKTSRGELRTTETQPLCQRLDAFVDVGQVQPGEVILSWSDDGSPDGEIHEAEVLGKIKTDEIIPVINLVLGNREPFIAGGFLARSKPPRDDVPVETASQSTTKHSHRHEIQP
jgi:hypothetical protein